MKITATPEVLQPQVQATVTPGNVDFQAALAAAKKKNPAETNQNSSASRADATGKKRPTSYRADVEFLADYAAKTPSQHIRDRIQQLREEILKGMGLSEESLAAMPPGQRETIEKSIMAEIQKRLFEKTDSAEKVQASPVTQVDLRVLKLTVRQDTPTALP